MNAINSLLKCFLYDEQGFVIFDDLTLMRVKKFFIGYASSVIQTRYLNYNVKVNQYFIDSQCKKVKLIVEDFNLKSIKVHEREIQQVIYQLEHLVREYLKGVLPN